MPGAVPLLGKAGDAYVFRTRSGTGRSPNRSGKARRPSLQLLSDVHAALRFGTPYSALFEHCTPRQRRLLVTSPRFPAGDFFYAPEDQASLMTGAA